MDVNKDGDFIWTTVLCNVLKEVFPAGYPTKDEIQTFLLEMENLQMKLDTERRPMSITNLTLKNLS